jgi:4-pyridoxolactonase
MELAAGLRLFETPGHSAGHYSLLIEPPSGDALLFAFDAAYAHESLERLIPSGFHLDPTAAVRSLRRIKKLARTYDARIFVAHDTAAFNGYSLAPAAAI